MHDKVTASVTKLEGLMVKTLARLCSIPAVSPHNGGTGEDAKILELAKIIDELGLKDIALKVEYVDDEKAQSGCISQSRSDYRQAPAFLEITSRTEKSLWEIQA